MNLSILEGRIEDIDKSLSVNSETSMSIKNNGCDKIGANVREQVAPSKITSLSFHLPETHIFTSPTSDTQEIVSQNNNTKFDENLFLKSTTKPKLNEGINLYEERFASVDTAASNKDQSPEILMPQAPFQNDPLEQIIKFEPHNYFESMDNMTTTAHDVNSFNFGTSNYDSKPVVSNGIGLNYDILMPTPNDNNINLKPKRKESDDFDTSFTEFQSYTHNKKTQNFDALVKPTCTTTQNSHILHRPDESISSTNLSTSNILQPIVTNSTLDHSFIKSDSDKLGNNDLFHENNSADDSQTEWSDFVSITTVSSAATPSIQSNGIDINAFKVPIKIDAADIKMTSKEISNSTDTDDWSDFVSSTPSALHSYSSKNIQPYDKWNRTGPQFNNWQTNTFYNPLAGSNFLMPHSSNSASGFDYNKQNTVSSAKSISDSNYMRFNNSKPNSIITSSSSQRSEGNDKISSITSVPELSFAVPQSFIHSINFSKK